MAERFISNQEALVLSAHGIGESRASDHHPDTNEDDYLVDDWDQVYGVYDGLGGHAGSAVVSHMAVESTYHYFRDRPANGITDGLAYDQMAEVIANTHRGILSYNKERRSESATTAAILRFHETEQHESKATIGHIGDSRVYLLRKDWKLYPLTLDHTPAIRANALDQLWADQYALDNAINISDLDESQARVFNNRHFVGYALGVGNDVPSPRLSVQAIDVRPEDRFILTTDGIHDNLTLSEMARAIEGVDDAKLAADGLIAAALTRSRENGHIRSKSDDMTVVVVDVPKV